MFENEKSTIKSSEKFSLPRTGVGTDSKGYYEFVINFVVYYRKG